MDKEGSYMSIQKKLREFKEGNPIRRVVPEGHALKLHLPEFTVLGGILGR